MAQEQAQRFAKMLAALSQPTRLRIVAVVAGGGEEGTPAGAIARALHCPASTLSFHLKELAQAGLLQAAPQGRYVRYSVQPDAFGALAAFVAGLSGDGRRGAGTAATTSRRKALRRKPGEKGAETATQGQLSIFSD